jgi:hypothetical protein
MTAELGVNEQEPDLHDKGESLDSNLTNDN